MYIHMCVYIYIYIYTYDMYMHMNTNVGAVVQPLLVEPLRPEARQ